MNQVAVEEGSQPYSKMTSGRQRPMAEPHATSALGGQDVVGQLTQPFFLFISPQDCAVRTLVSRGAGKREQEPEILSPLWTEVQLMFFPTHSRPSNPDGRGCGAATGQGL